MAHAQHDILRVIGVTEAWPYFWRSGHVDAFNHDISELCCELSACYYDIGLIVKEPPMTRLKKAAANEAMAEARTLLLDNPKVLRRKVRNVAAVGDKDECALALYTLAAGHKFDWTPQDWRAVLNRLDNCESTVEEWLNV